jgi:hypothetical protein
VAVGDAHATVELVYPERDTWLGAVSADVARTVDGGQLITETVDLVSLDDYQDLASQGRLLIKIDVEGLEVPVLNGARGILETARPTIIFEANEDADRIASFDILSGTHYLLFELPWPSDESRRPLSVDEFSNSPGTNFIARPRRQV